MKCTFAMLYTVPVYTNERNAIQYIFFGKKEKKLRKHQAKILALDTDMNTVIIDKLMLERRDVGVWNDHFTRLHRKSPICSSIVYGVDCTACHQMKGQRTSAIFISIAREQVSRNLPQDAPAETVHALRAKAFLDQTLKVNNDGEIPPSFTPPFE